MSAQTRRFAVVASVLIAAGGAGEALADGQPAPKPGERKSFVACPMVRNTYVPCWLAEHEGELYYLGVQGDLNAEFYPPQLGHKALIEGTVSDGPRICGGIVLEPVHVSVLPELTPSCNTILPDEGHASPPYHRTPGPNNSEREERADRGPDLPARPPAEGVTFIVPFEFDVGERLYSRDSRIVTMAARYARDVGASRIKVTGYTGGALLSSGELLKERAVIGELRARNIEAMLRHAGISADALEVEWREAEAPDGIDDHLTRRAEIVVMP